MGVRSLTLAIALGAVLVCGFALLSSLLRSEDSPLSNDDRTGTGAGHPDLNTALHDVAHFTLFGKHGATPSTERAYVVEGMRRLATALELLAQRDGLLSSRFDAPGHLRRAADALGHSETAETAAITREAFARAADAASELQERRYPQLARVAEKLKSVALGLRTDRVLVDQHPAIEEYFDVASDMLTPMILLRR